MVNRLFRIALMSAVVSFAGTGVAFADNHEGGDPCAGDPCGGENPCAGNPCGGDADPCAGNPCGGDTTAAPSEGAEGAAPGKKLGLDKGQIGVNGWVYVNLSTDLVGKPISIAPDIYYGVDDKLTVGLTHSSVGASGFIDNARGGICVTGEDNGCTDPYDNVGVNATYEFLNDGKLIVGADGGLQVLGFDPLALAVKVGVKGSFAVNDKISIHFNPNIFIGVTERDAAGNKETLNVPVGLMFGATPELHVGLQTGIRGPLDGFGDSWQLPVALGAGYMVNKNITAGATFGLTGVAGGDFGKTEFDGRSLNVFFNWRS